MRQQADKPDAASAGTSTAQEAVGAEQAPEADQGGEVAAEAPTKRKRKK
jgi:hypothetical protein